MVAKGSLRKPDRDEKVVRATSLSRKKGWDG